MPEGGVGHYVGAGQIARADHAECDAQVAGIVAYHENHGYRQGGAYNEHACQHGGRWLHYLGPNQATGNTWANLNLHAVCAVIGDGDEPSDLLKRAMRNAWDEAGAGQWITPHSHWFNTSCCGDPLRTWIAVGAPAPTAPIEQESGDMEYLVKNVDDGQWWYFPPFCAPARQVTPDFVLGRASFIPHGDSNGPTIVAMDQERALHRNNFVNQVASTVPVPPAGGGGGVTEAQVRAIVTDVVDGTTLKV